MNIQNSSSPNFKAKVSQSVLLQLQKQLKHCRSREKCSAMVKNQIENIKGWGSPDSEIVIAQDHKGRYLLGVKCRVAGGLKISWGIRNLTAKTELSQFLSLKKSHIEETEDSIRFLLKEHGIDYFEKHNGYKR